MAEVTVASFPGEPAEGCGDFLDSMSSELSIIRNAKARAWGKTQINGSTFQFYVLDIEIPSWRVPLHLSAGATLAHWCFKSSWWIPLHLLPANTLSITHKIPKDLSENCHELWPHIRVFQVPSFSLCSVGLIELICSSC